MSTRKDDHKLTHKLRKIKDPQQQAAYLEYLDVLIARQQQLARPLTWREAIFNMLSPMPKPRPLIYIAFMSIAALCMVTIYLSAFHGNAPLLTLALDLIYLITFFAWLYFRYSNRLTMTPIQASA